MNFWRSFGLCCLSLTFLQCEKDDICSASTPTTPSLIIRFYDFNNPTELKAVENLKVFGLDDSGSSFDVLGLNVITTDSLALPLPTHLNAATFQLFINYESEEVTGNGDGFMTGFQTQDIFVSRACGYKTFYSELLAESIPDSDNWILNTEVVQTEINNTIHAHVKIYH